MKPIPEQKNIEPNFKEIPEGLNIVPAPGGSTIQGGKFAVGGGKTELNSSGVSTFKDVVIGSKQVVISSGEDIQKAIDSLTNGGTVYLRAGTHLVESNITLSNSVKILGENRDNTIINFNSTSAHFIVAGTDAYTTGTISSIGSGGTVVTGSGTSWNTSNNVTTSHQIFIDNRWYKITSVDSDTQVTLAEPYKDAATFSGTYRAVKLRTDIHFNSLTMKNSTSQVIDFDDVRDVRMDDLLLISNNKGFTMDNFTFVVSSGIIITNSTSNGYELTNGKFFNSQPIASQGNGGHGCVLNSISSCAWIYCANDGNTNDGVNATSIDKCALTIQTDGNGGQGIEFVSGCDDNRIYSNSNANTSDGVKLTASSDNNVITTSVIRANGGYGVNIAASTCDNNVIATNHFGGNTSEAVNDSGTGTKVTGNIGVVDNATDVQIFTSSGTYTKPSGAVSVKVQIWGAGGGGGDAVASSSAGGGGGGSYLENTFDASDIGATETITIGSGGTSGAQGGNTTFGSLMTVYGGGGGSTTANGQSGGGGGGAGVSGKGNTGTSGASSGTGGTGGAPLGSAADTANGGYGGAGGGSGGTGGLSVYGGAGGGGVTNDITGGAGGSSIYAGGGGGAGGTSSAGSGGVSEFSGNGGAGGSNANGTAGTQPAGGGGGASSSSGTKTGGTGGDGQVIVTSFI